ncbi:MAG: CMP/dCMP deaminase zinc-binding protein [Sediminibacterium sp.]|nr:CMP/dCMP deaminase zinc-binding protein [Sediminibacterium sp.]
MTHQKINIEFEEYDSIDQLTNEDASLLREAIKATDIAYAPYSHFHVGATALLANGKTISGSNQENASYPVGLCAERVLLSAASSVYPGVPITTMAISYRPENGKSNRPISPCGVCRQTLVEYETLLKHPIRLILGGIEGKIWIIPQAGSLLPFGFSGEDLK